VKNVEEAKVILKKELPYLKEKYGVERIVLMGLL
jgi:predicted nucleotidyltransferase